jgi:nucleotide-binding universal stress UspA family protein
MKVVIGHDGSSYADAAIADLQRAGLPEKVEAMVVTVGDAPLVAPFASHRIIEQTFVGERVRSIVEHANRQAEDALSEASDIAQSAAMQLSLHFPSWKVSGEVVSGAPAAQLIRTASQLNADLVVVGTHGRSALGRLILGSVSHEVLTHAPCSVRVGRGMPKGNRAGLRILVGLDRRSNADKILRQILQRSWPRATELRVVTVDDGDATTTFGTFQELFAGDVKVSAGFLKGDMRELLILEARRWQADCIVLGPETIDARPEGLLESTLWTDLLSGAECSLEIVR